jgi:cyclopropane fatty-acyl-phospholipid synthase-like methyltransferase
MDLYADGALYDALSGPEVIGAELEFYRRQALREPGTSVLELGCGTGRLTIPLAKGGISVTGLDLSSAMLATARSKAHDMGFPVHFEQADVRDFRLPERFRLILFPSNAVAHLETEREVESCFRCAAAHLADGGLLVVHAFNPHEDLPCGAPGDKANVGSFVDRAGLSWTVTETGRYDEQQRIQILRWAWSAADGRKRETELRLRMYWPDELDDIARRAGLEVRDRVGDFAAAPFTRSSRHQILTLGKR